MKWQLIYAWKISFFVLSGNNVVKLEICRGFQMSVRLILNLLNELMQASGENYITYSIIVP